MLGVQELAAQGIDYAPVWSTAGGGQSIGDGAIVGRYAEFDGLVNFYIAFRAGPTTSFGTGAWFFTLPFNVATGPVVDYSWPGTVVDVGGPAYAVSGIYNGPNLVTPKTGHPLAAVTGASPMPWSAANEDRLFVSGWYWRA